MKAYEIAGIFEQIAPIDSGIPGDELGFVWGDPDIEVSGVGCMWCVDTGSIQRCVNNGITLIICHESMWLPAQVSPWYESSENMRIKSNDMRRDLLKKHRITVYRSHSNWDALPEYGIADSAVNCLGFKDLHLIARQKFFSVHELPEPVRAEELMKHVEAGLEFEECRIFGDKDRMISRFAFLIGGFGENQYHMPQMAMEMGAEAIIIGEMSEFILIACLEMGLPVIETLHSVSEIPGIKNQVKVLKARLPEMNIQYIASGAEPFKSE